MPMPTRVPSCSTVMASTKPLFGTSTHGLVKVARVQSWLSMPTPTRVPSCSTVMASTKPLFGTNAHGLVKVARVQSWLSMPTPMSVGPTVRLRGVPWLRLPDVPVTLRVKLPVGAEDEAARVSVEVALPPEAGVTLGGWKFAVTPAGNPDALKLMTLLNPFTLVTFTVELPLLPCDTVNDDGDTL